MTAYQITRVSSVNGRAAVKTYKTEGQAQKAWTATISDGFTRYALWVDLSAHGEMKGIRGEHHGRYYFGAMR